MDTNQKINPFLKADALSSQAAQIRVWLDKASSLCKKIETQASAFAESIHGQEDMITLQDEDKMVELDAMYYQLRTELHSVYETLTQPQTFNFQRHDAVAKVEDFLRFNDAGEHIVACVSDSRVHIRIPLLWSRGNYKKWVKRHRITYDYLHWFTDNLDAALTLIEHEIPNFGHKNISYLFVISPSEKEGRGASEAIVDSDNRDTKAISDIIASRFRGGDSALSCAFSFASTTSETLIPGTYITVSEGLDNPLTIEAQKQLFQQLPPDKSNCFLKSSKNYRPEPPRA